MNLLSRSRKRVEMKEEGGGRRRRRGKRKERDVYANGAKS